MPPKKSKRVMVFGAFDLLHPGHLYLLYHARMQGEELIVVIARDATVQRLKGIAPAWDQKKRTRAVVETGLVTKAVLGDAKEGTYAIARKYEPDIICLGYDQALLKKDLQAAMASNRLPKIPLYTLRPYKAKIFHTSLVRKRL